MEDETSKVLESELAYKIVRSLAVNMEEKYSKEIAEELGEGTTKQSVSNYLKKLRDIDFIARGKRTKAQYYAFNFSGLYDFWIEELESNLNELEEKLEQGNLEMYQLSGLDQERFGKEMMKQQPQVFGKIELEKTLNEYMKDKLEGVKKDFDEIKEQERFKSFMEAWVMFYVSERKNSTLGEMIFTDLQKGLHSIQGNDDILHPLLDQDIETILFALDLLEGGESVSLATRVAIMEGTSRMMDDMEQMKAMEDFLNFIDNDLAQEIRSIEDPEERADRLEKAIEDFEEESNDP